MGSGEWELFDLEADPAETRDLASAEPGKVRELETLWDDYAAENGVVLLSRDAAFMTP